MSWMRGSALCSLVVLMNAAPVLAQEAPAPVAQPVDAPVAVAAAAPAPTDAELHEDLRTLQRTMEKALNSRDIDTIVANVHDDVVFTTMNGDVARGKQGVRDYFHKMMQGPDKIVDAVQTRFEADDLSLLHGGHTAVAFGKTDDHYVLTSGERFDVQARWSGTMVRKQDGWIVASFHYSTNMFDNPVLSAQRRLFGWVGGVGAVALAALAFLLGRRSRA
jgi:uncharacterized protein (TIGR02246 family)